MIHENAPLPGLLPLEGVVRHYDWGSRTFLASLRGRPAPSPQPEAELWFGAHSSAPSRVRVAKDPVLLDSLIASRPREILGPLGDRERAELPFLLKILAAERPLSIQLHPDAGRARAGYLREESAGVDRSAATRLYRDPNAKPEIALALTPFQALQGLRPPEEARALLATLSSPETDALLESSATAEPTALLEALLSLDPTAARALSSAARRAAAHARGREAAWVLRLAEACPGDPLVIAPLLLNLVELSPGEALYTPPGVIHSYLDGAIVELMSSSDNVLRAGLTRKHVDPPALLAALDPRPSETRVLTPRVVDGSPWRELTDTGPLRLQLVDLEDGSVELEAREQPSVLLAISGEVTARCRDGSQARLRAGEAALMTASAPPGRLGGTGRIYRAGAAAS